MKNKVIFIVIILIVLVGLVGYKLITNSSSGSEEETGDYTIILTEDGFEPSELTITKGESITFKTTAGNPFWPASDIHPTHTIYSDFDPGDAIMSDKTWTFKFEKSGSWRFHDHLAQYFTGRINVTE